MKHLAFLALSCCLLRAADAPKITNLSIGEAIQLAVGSDLAAIQLAHKAVATARGKVMEARSAKALLAQASVADRGIRVDLRSLGIDLPRFSELLSSTQFPGTRGPYSVFDPRLQATKTLIDRSVARKIAAAAKGVEEAQSAAAEEREAIAAETARVYLSAVRAAEVAELAAGNVRMAETMLDMATERRNSGLATESELRSARVQINSERQKASAALLERSRAVLRLLYLVGGNFEDSLELTSPIPQSAAGIDVEDAVTLALRNNPRLHTLRIGEERLKLTESAVTATRLPVVSTYGDVGMVIVAPSPSGVDLVTHGLTFTAGLEAKMTILDGHRRALAQAAVSGEISEKQLRERDLRREIELNVRTACASLVEAANETELADASLRESAADLNEIRANYAAGNSSGLDLQLAGRRHAAAADAKASASYAQAQARITLAEAMGAVTSLTW